MLFLGHVKSNISMIRSLLKHHKLESEFSNQCNDVLYKVSKLHLRRFNAQQFSADNGTGTWVSENYLFFSRSVKYFYSIPALRNMAKPKCQVAKKCIQKLSNSCAAVLSRLMSEERSIPNLNHYVKLYMDCMVEMDCLLSCQNNPLSPLNQNEENKSILTDDDESEHSDASQTSLNNLFSKKANYVKSNSLGILGTVAS